MKPAKGCRLAGCSMRFSARGMPWPPYPRERGPDFYISFCNLLPRLKDTDTFRLYKRNKCVFISQVLATILDCDLSSWGNKHAHSQGQEEPMAPLSPLSLKKATMPPKLQVWLPPWCWGFLCGAALKYLDVGNRGTHQASGPSACQADALPLSYTPT